MWCYKNVLRISRIDKITNVKLLERIAERKLLWKNIVKRRNKWISNLMWYEGLLKLIIKESIEGKTKIKNIQQIIKD